MQVGNPIFASKPIEHCNKMNALETRATLLIRLRDASDQEAWRLFASIYTPLVYRYAMKNGLQDADAADVAQETMCNVVRVIRDFEYDPKRGSFRGWLLTVVRNTLRKRHRKAQHQALGSGDTQVHSLLQQSPDPSPDSDEEWDREYELWLFHKVAKWIKEEFQSKTWDAFWKTTVEGQEVTSVASELSMTPGAIYIARSRVLARIRTEIEKIEGLEHA
jgi:RNA polymerase sigma factor (sigma-70 family)